MAADSDAESSLPRYGGRGLCRPCYYRLKRTGELVAFERLTHSWNETLEDWRILRSRGIAKGEAAERIGVTQAALDRALRQLRAVT